MLLSRSIKLDRNVVLISPFLIILINYIVAIAAGQMVGKWVFVPIILIEWCLFMFFVLRYGRPDSIKKWLKAPEGRIGWTIFALIIGIIPLPIFLMHYGLLSPWQIWLPWLLLALINPWIEEFYWRGLLLDHTVPGIDGTYIHERALFDRLLAAQERMSAEIGRLLTLKRPVVATKGAAPMAPQSSAS